MRRRGGWGAGYWALPAGHTEGIESLSDAASREASEELGIQIQPSDFKIVHAMHRPSVVAGQKTRVYADFFLETITWAGTPEIAEPDKCSEIKFYDEQELPKPLVLHVDHALEKIRKGQPFSQSFGWPNAWLQQK